MFGRVGRAWTNGRDGEPEPGQSVVWLAEWNSGNLYADLAHGRLAVPLSGPEAEAARAAFAAITCATCLGTGRRDRVAGKRIETPVERCPSRTCAQGRKLGVEPGLDASYAAWKHETEAREITERLFAQAGRSAAELEAARTSAERPVVLRFPGVCLACGRKIPAGETAMTKRAEDRWTIRCAAHGQVAVS